MPGPEGAVLTVEFSLDGHHCTGLNGGPQFYELMADPDRDRAHRATRAMPGTKKLDVAELERAADAR